MATTTAATTVSVETQIEACVHEISKVSYLEEAFNCVIIHKPKVEEDKIQVFHKQIQKIFTNLSAEQKEATIKILLNITANHSNLAHLKCLLQTIPKLVNANIVTSRLVCEQILLCESLVYQNKNFWIECFQLIRKIIGGVDYKGVREIMKGCRDKIQTFPHNINQSILPQMTAVESVLEYIFDRNNCLLPAYFVANEIQKSAPLHWKIAALTNGFVEDFRKIAQMVTIIGHTQMRPIVEHFGYTESLINPWRLDSTTLKFTFRGILPYDADLLQPQTQLLRYVLEMTYSKDMVCSMLNLQKQTKQRCAAIEDQLVWLIMSAMERSEIEPLYPCEPDDTTASIHWLWLHISSQLIYFVLFQFANFPNIVTTLQEKLSVREYRKGRDYLMWALLQFISGSIQRNPLTNFMSVLSLFDILYPETEPLPIPDTTKTYSTRQMAATCIWMHLHKKAQTELVSMHRPLPISLKNHYEYLQHMMLSSSTPLSMGPDFSIVLLCNAYSTNPDYFARPMAALFETINKSSVGSNQQPMPTVPLSMVTLDSLTVHSKMSLIHSIVSHIIKQAQTKNMPPNMAPALVETYSRLLVYTEIESLGIKGFLSQLLPAVFKSHAWGILYTLLEMLSYRMHHIQPFYRVQLLSHLHSLASVPHTNKTQLHLCVESTALRLITGLGSAEVQPQLSRYFSEPKVSGSIVWTDSEELNRVLILTIARAMHISGTGMDDQSNSWCKDLLSTIMQHTPHSWDQNTLNCFPPVLSTFLSQTNMKENKQLLKKSVDEEYRNWMSMTNENDIITHFSVSNTPPVFLCLLFKMVLETGSINSVASKILEGIGPRALTLHLRKLCDHLILEVASTHINVYINNCVNAVNDLIWKYNVITLDRLVLCMILRAHEGNEGQVCLYVIQLLFLKSNEFRNRVQEFVRDNSPDHWRQNNWYEKHIAFHQKFREKFALDESSSMTVFFGNACLRFLPVLDLLIHRFLELPAPSNVTKAFEVILEHLSCLYKFHDRPITYLYNTLHYYEQQLRERPPMKKLLVTSVIGSLAEIRPANWALTKKFEKYLKTPDTEVTAWQPELSYYVYLMNRLVDTITGKKSFYVTDWRFNEFPNAAAHALYTTCVELLGLPIGPLCVANNLIDAIIKGCILIPQNQTHNYINALGLLLAALPETYWSVIYDRVKLLLLSKKMTEWPYRQSPFEMFNFNTVREGMLERNYVLLLAIAQSLLHHSSIGQLATLADYIKEKLKAYVQTEAQLIYVCHLFGPFILRLDQERPRIGYELTTLLYELLEQVDKHNTNVPLKYMDSICDLLYHIKYMFVGDILKVGSETIIRRLRPALQMRLRFITHLNVDQITAPVSEQHVENVSTDSNHQLTTVKTESQTNQTTQQIQPSQTTSQTSQPAS